MPAYRYPVLIWKDASGGATASLVSENENASAYAPSVNEALDQLREWLEWRAIHQGHDIDPNIADPVYFVTAVETHLQYLSVKRRIPCPETLSLRVPCVSGVESGGAKICLIPHFGLSFNYQDASSLKSLVAHYVRETLQALSPAGLAERLPPRDCELGEVLVRIPAIRTKHRPPEDRPELKVLFTVADPLLHGPGARKAANAHGRAAIVNQVVVKLVREKTSILLVGASGSGKSTILADAAKQVVFRELGGKPDEDKSNEESEGDDLRSFRYWRGTAGRIIAGMRYLGEWQERCEEFIQQLGAIEGLFCVENLLELLQAGGEGPIDSVGAFLLPYLQNGELRMVAEATPEELAACRRLLPALVDVFQIIEVPAMTEAEAIGALSSIASAQTASGKIQVAPGAINLVYRLFARFQPYAAFPGVAAGFVRALCDSRRLSKEKKKEVSNSDVIELFVRQTGLPEVFLRDDLPLRLEEVRSSFADRIIGQVEATQIAARAVVTIKAGLCDPRRPLGVLLLCGPTGVGKTAIAKALSEYCFGASGQKDRLIRLDMSEYSGWDASHRLLHHPQGGPAAWIERVRRQPFCVLLFDEIEKAAPPVFDTLLGLLDEGRLTDRFGRVADFRSALILLTSNLGSSANGPLGFVQEGGPSYESAVAKFFRPEFFNRQDAVVTFRPLGLPEVEAIARIELAKIGQREGFVSANIRINFSDKVVNHAAQNGFDPRLGARPLQRAIERLVVTPLARWKVAHPSAKNVTLDIDLDAAGSIVVKRRH